MQIGGYQYTLLALCGLGMLPRLVRRSLLFDIFGLHGRLGCR